MSLISNLKWRYATKKFDATKKVSNEDIESIKKAGQLSASSYGLQPYRILQINDSALRAKLQPASWNQTQIVDASHLFVVCNMRQFGAEEVNAYLELKAKNQGLDVTQLKGYGDFIVGKLSERSAEEISAWTAKQSYIALGNMMAACAELHIDACPMEGFEASAYNEILNLESKNLEAAVVLAVGYRHPEDQTKDQSKVRFPLDELFLEV